MNISAFRMPSAYTILFLLIIVMIVGTWFIPAGLYDRNDAGQPIPGTYHEVDPHPQRLMLSFMAPVSGMYGIQGESGKISPYESGTLFGAIDVSLFVLVIGGFLGVTMKTGAIDAAIRSITIRFRSREKLMIPLLMILFAIGGTTYGMAEETLAFYILIIAIMIAAGYDALTGVAVIMLGAGIGVLGSTVNPFATGIASGFAGVSIGDGILLRFVLLAACLFIGIMYVMRYAERVRNDPSASLVYELKEENEKKFMGNIGNTDLPVITRLQGFILVLFGLAFAIMIYSVIPWKDLGLTSIPTLGWGFAEYTALFLFFAIIIGICDRMKEFEIADSFVRGAADLLGVALIIALARGITVVMNNGLITDTVLFWCNNALSGFSAVPFIDVMFVIYIPLSFLIPSSSGLAALTMPVMAPLGSLAGVNESLIVTAYQSASGLVNLINPTFAVVMGGLAIGRISYGTWLRFVGPLMLMLAVLIIILLSLGASFGIM